MYIAPAVNFVRRFCRIAFRQRRQLCGIWNYGSISLQADNNDESNHSYISAHDFCDHSSPLVGHVVEATILGRSVQFVVEAQSFRQRFDEVRDESAVTGLTIWCGAMSLWDQDCERFALDSTKEITALPNQMSSSLNLQLSINVNWEFQTVSLISKSQQSR